jgi:hypothetical protein
MTSEGILLVTSIDNESPNFTAHRIHAGDEIIEVRPFLDREINCITSIVFTKPSMDVLDK